MCHLGTDLMKTSREDMDVYQSQGLGPLRHLQNMVLQHRLFRRKIPFRFSGILHDDGPILLVFV